MALSRKTKPTMEWTKDGDTYKTMVTAPGMPERHQTFKLDVEFDEVAIGNRKVKVQTHSQPKLSLSCTVNTNQFV